MRLANTPTDLENDPSKSRSLERLFLWLRHYASNVPAISALWFQVAIANDEHRTQGHVYGPKSFAPGSNVCSYVFFDGVDVNGFVHDIDVVLAE